jgi:UDP-N-acetylglucosamine:LPS N-acetylglucosamine transferase
MDILKLGKKSILIPTPGQAEQEYLAWYLHKKKLAYAADQKNFSLIAALEDTRNFFPASISQSAEEYKIVLEGFARSLKEHVVNRRA